MRDGPAPRGLPGPFRARGPHMQSANGRSLGGMQGVDEDSGPVRLLGPASATLQWPSADAVRQFADCRRSEISNVIQPQLDKIRAFLEGYLGLAFRLGGVVRPNDRGDFRHLIAPQSSRVSASRSGGRLPRAAGALRPRV